jgi:hypothetical protein
MDALELLGQVEPADQVVLDAALEKLNDAIHQDSGHVTANSLPARRRRRMTAAVAAAAAVTVAATLAVITSLGTAQPSRSHPGGQGRSATAPAGFASPAHPQSAIAAVLTAFSASSSDILQVTKAVYGEGPCCRASIWISPAAAAPGTTVRSRVVDSTLAGKPVEDMAITYIAPARIPAAGAYACEGLFSRPKIAFPPTSGVPGMATVVDYPARLFAEGHVQVRPATVPNTAALRACFKDGQWRVLGRTTRAGTKEIEFASADGSERLWVSAATFLPVQLTSTTPRPGGSPIVVTFGFKFMPPTAANDALLTLTIPAGFSRAAI